jgi:hypothetical protein
MAMMRRASRIARRVSQRTTERRRNGLLSWRDDTAAAIPARLAAGRP